MWTLRKRARRVIKVQVVVTTNTLCEIWMDEDHRSLIDRIKGLANSGLTNAQVAQELTRQGVKSRTGRVFYAELVGALMSKYKRAEASKFVDMAINISWQNT
jgi:hypothetical protein